MRVPKHQEKPLTLTLWEEEWRAQASQKQRDHALVVRHLFSHSLSSAGPVSERTPLLWVRIFYQAIYLPPFVVFGEILGNR